MDIPASGAGQSFLNDALDFDGLRLYLDKILQVLEQGFGLTQGEEQLTVSGGSLTPNPTRQMLVLAHGASTADLSSIPNANIPEGRLIHVRIANAANAVVLKHGTGAQQLSMGNTVDHNLNRTDMGVVFARRGSLWVEAWRSPCPSTAVTPTLSGTWAHGALSLRYSAVGAWCHVVGDVTNPSTISSSSQIFVLPAGFRPIIASHFLASLVKAGDDFPCRIQVNGSDGAVSFVPMGGWNCAVGDTVSIALSFPILN